MEYKQAKMRETPDERLVGRHQSEIAPLLKRRWQFAESENFLLYDFWTGVGDGGRECVRVFEPGGRGGIGECEVCDPLQQLVWDDGGDDSPLGGVGGKRRAGR